ncbi:hypothetical protein DICPUDRAFT_78144 [Dictyostelium purpureum]|uniref:Uncharacterized protein n=1 Tax=Dictyostelium purpureum TaxID=5786 RepID=F0ZIP1_DICPU|nr:uncharacterized protein DICPUDRAFT_78144 [Dictyostelium purpureum]EGC36203.1 hypothetical protein DICPUDRAFT_78144 [Dictyostelium purpureum]|eukprot:XP_003287270.1 hypothetical protein DICPUDRAFT_78144 [Dictyostelium purpureum]
MNKYKIPTIKNEELLIPLKLPNEITETGLEFKEYLSFIQSMQKELDKKWSFNTKLFLSLITTMAIFLIILFVRIINPVILSIIYGVIFIGILICKYIHFKKWNLGVDEIIQKYNTKHFFLGIKYEKKNKIKPFGKKTYDLTKFYIYYKTSNVTPNHNQNNDLNLVNNNNNNIVLNINNDAIILSEKINLI